MRRAAASSALRRTNSLSVLRDCSAGAAGREHAAGDFFVHRFCSTKHKSPAPRSHAAVARVKVREAPLGAQRPA